MTGAAELLLPSYMPLTPSRSTGAPCPSTCTMMPYARMAAFSAGCCPRLGSRHAAARRACSRMPGSASSSRHVMGLNSEERPDCLVPDHRSPGPLW